MTNGVNYLALRDLARARLLRGDTSLSLSRLYQLVEEGKLPVIRLGSLLVVRILDARKIFQLPESEGTEVSYLSPKEFADLALGRGRKLSPSRISRLIGSGSLPAERIGGRYFIDAEIASLYLSAPIKKRGAGKTRRSPLRDLS